MTFNRISNEWIEVIRNLKIEIWRGHKKNKDAGILTK
jgi:hypothetical protein